MLGVNSFCPYQRGNFCVVFIKIWLTVHSYDLHLQLNLLILRYVLRHSSDVLIFTRSIDIMVRDYNVCNIFPIYQKRDHYKSYVPFPHYPITQLRSPGLMCRQNNSHCANSPSSRVLQDLNSISSVIDVCIVYHYSYSHNSR